MQAINRKEAQTYLSAFNFRTFFTELMGWNAAPASSSFKSVDLQQYRFTPIAEKKGYTVLLCSSIPPYPIRAKLDRLVSRDYFEHIIIFADPDAKRQVWQVSLREKGQPVRLREVAYRVGASGEELIQKLQQIAVPLELEESTHLSDLTNAARAAFNREKVTKSFFKQFELEHKSFLTFLKGVPTTTEGWYVSVLINRLMFLYFMQSKNFLDSNSTYLTDKLQGFTANKTDSFYRDFLCPLFFEGFALKKESRSPAIKALLGGIPYLNGGLFQKHAIELRAEADGSLITIPDVAFQQLFAFFDKWTWHLDPDENATGDEIDPDVLGYIFEKYINQKQMGAYYTKEDITGYIAQNTIIPFLFDSAEKGCSNAFLPDGAIWRMLRDDPDVYIYPAMRRGNTQAARLQLPTDIAAGIDNVRLRTSWNRPVPADFADAALPTETWREFMARRLRYDELRTRIAAGELHQINDVITHNLDVRRLAVDAIRMAGSEDLVESFYKAIESVTILDPTCGSGAFLFAALELLEPLYQECLLRMREFVEEASTETAAKAKKVQFNRFTHFSKTLDAAARHVNIEYFILKTIIVKNLYGVDIMEEATEICKLRLFLKLVAQIDANQKDKIEPLPDIDFNIRAGNTLVGYARYEDVKKAAGGNLFDAEEAMSRIDDGLRTVDAAASEFRRQQTELGGSVSTESKAALNALYKRLENELDDFLASELGVKKKEVAEWKRNTKPFHWFCDFHSIIQRGGFDVIIGNPPYVEYRRSEVDYQVRGYESLESANLWAFVFERSLRLLAAGGGRSSLIVPLSLISADRMSSIFRYISSTSTYTTLLALSGDAHPSVLFDGVKMSYTIACCHKGSAPSSVVSSKLYRWLHPERKALFESLGYEQVRAGSQAHEKIGSSVHHSIIRKLNSSTTFARHHIVSGHGTKLLYHRIVRHFVKSVIVPPYFWNERDGEKRSEDYKELLLDSSEHAQVLRSVLISNTFYLYFLGRSDSYHLGRDLILQFPVNLPALAEIAGQALTSIGQRHESSLKENSVRRRIFYKATGWIEYDEFYPRLSKAITDEVDVILAKHYGFSDEELDFIINYDFKYRMGSANEEAES